MVNPPWAVILAWWLFLLTWGVGIGAVIVLATDRPDCYQLCKRNGMAVRFKCEHPDMIACMCDGTKR